MICLACNSLGPSTLCETCAHLLRPAPEQFIAGVGVVRSAYLHRDPARLLVHHLKYRGVVASGWRLAEAMAALVPGNVALVPVPRVGWRRVRYGIDPAIELATALSRITGSPVRAALSAPLWGKPRAGGTHGFAPRFRLRRPPTEPVILIDDVITTGTTLAVAARLLPGVVGAVTATTSTGQRVDRST
jgi:predicted amidophosphoribosyltransferase